MELRKAQWQCASTTRLECHVREAVSYRDSRCLLIPAGKPLSGEIFVGKRGSSMSSFSVTLLSPLPLSRSLSASSLRFMFTPTQTGNMEIENVDSPNVCVLGNYCVVPFTPQLRLRLDFTSYCYGGFNALYVHSDQELVLSQVLQLSLVTIDPKLFSLWLTHLAKLTDLNLLLRRVYPGDAVTSVGTLPTTFNPFRIPVALSTKGEDRTIVRARQMLAEAQARRDNGTSCSYIGHNSSREMSDILTSNYYRFVDTSSQPTTICETQILARDSISSIGFANGAVSTRMTTDERILISRVPSEGTEASHE
ncbi:hypothetical protein EAG_00708 [Camponotus floridanus]|uniref:Uncharacterized protein n=1 Tax=Camponotus floridanus TaxID=104421 RepID=E2AIM9_CAMFO|nr:hypothetical protein EAG_00708 [Camponotus floridanus]